MIDIFALFLLLLTFFVCKVRNAEMLTKLDFKMMLFLNPNLGGGSKNYYTSHCLKPVKIMLETSNLACKYTPICSFRKYTFQCLAPLNFADVSIFLQKNQRFLSKKVPLLKAIVLELCQKFFSSAFNFCKNKGYLLLKT